MRTLPALAASLGLLAACGAHQTRPAAPPASPQHATATPPEAPANQPDLACAQIARAEVAAPRSPPPPSVVTIESHVFGRCMPAQGPARWAYVRDAVRWQSSSGGNGDEGEGEEVLDGYEGTWVLTHLDARGAKVTVVPFIDEDNALHEGGLHDVNFAAVPGSYRVEVPEPEVFDFDGDGDPEVVVHLTRSAAGGDPLTLATIYTFREGRIVRYPPAAGLYFDAVRDGDGDGRPDLFTTMPFASLGADPNTGGSVVLEGPEFLLHARPDGTFSPDDAAAAAAAAARCPGVPPVLRTVQDVACARVRGLSAADARRAVSRDCAALRNGEDPTAFELTSCRLQQQVALVWAETDPPVTVPAPRAGGRR